MIFLLNNLAYLIRLCYAATKLSHLLLFNFFVYCIKRNYTQQLFLITDLNKLRVYDLIKLGTVKKQKLYIIHIISITFSQLCIYKLLANAKKVCSLSLQLYFFSNRKKTPIFMISPVKTFLSFNFLHLFASCQLIFCLFFILLLYLDNKIRVLALGLSLICLPILFSVVLILCYKTLTPFTLISASQQPIS